MNEKYKALCDIIGKYSRVGVCLSGGSDSALVAIAAAQTLGEEGVAAITVDTAFFTGEEMDISARLCAKLGIQHITPHAAMLNDPDVIKNCRDRCYYCKRHIIRCIREAAAAYDLETLMDGSNAENVHNYRPGERALAEYNILSPLKKAGMKKADIHEALRELGYKDFVRHEDACLATRIATDEPITLKKLRWIRAAEHYLQQMGFEVVRVCVSGGNARIEVGQKEIARLFDAEKEITAELRGMGYGKVTLDPRGYRRAGYCLGE